MSFFGLVIRNLWSKKARSIGLTFAVAFAVMAVVTLGVTSSGLEQSAAAIISVGKADFTVVQKGVSDTLASTIENRNSHGCGQTPGVQSAIGVLVETQHINADNPVFIEIGINPGDFTGVRREGGGWTCLLVHRGPPGDAGLAGRGQPGIARRRPVQCQRHLEHGRRHLFDRQRLRRRRGDVPASGHSGLQQGPGNRHLGLRQGESGSVCRHRHRHVSTTPSPSSPPFAPPPSSGGRTET